MAKKLHAEMYLKNQQNSKSKLRLNTALIILMLVIMTLVFSLMVLWTPIRIDDFVFMGYYHKFGGGDSFSWQGMLDYWLHCREVENARFANFCAPFTTLFEPWITIFPYLSGLVCTAVIVISMKLTGIRRNPATVLALMWLAQVFLLPWNDNLFVRDYILNYPYSAFFGLLFIYGMCTDGGNKLRKPLYFFAILICGLLAAGWHEGLAIPILAGMGVWALSQRLRMSWQWWVIMICFGVVTFAVFICPSMILRMSQNVGTGNYMSLWKVLIKLFPATLAILVTATGMCIKQTRPILKRLFVNPSGIVIFTAMIVAFVICIFTTYTNRMAYFPILFAIIFYGQLFKPYIERFKSKTSLIISIVCAAICTAQGIAACVWEYRIKVQHDIAFPLMLSSPTGTAFYDVYLYDDIPAYTLYFPSRKLWVDSWAYIAIDQNYGSNPHHMLVPTELRHPKGRKVSADGKIFSTGKNIWSVNIPELRKSLQCKISYKMHDGEIKSAIATPIYHFISEDGDSLLLYRPYYIDISQIDSVKIEEY